MSMLSPTSLTGVITWLGINSDAADLSTTSCQEVMVDYEGFRGDVHSGLTRKSCVRVQRQYPRGTEIRNTRQISALSVEELELVRQRMQIEVLQPGWVGANLILQGLPDFSRLPPSSRLIASNGTSLVVDMENAPCRFPGDIIERHQPGKGRLFAKAAPGLRGITLWVERCGTLVIGDALRLHVPPACDWRLEDYESA